MNMLSYPEALRNKHIKDEVCNNNTPMKPEFLHDWSIRTSAYLKTKSTDTFNSVNDNFKISNNNMNEFNSVNDNFESTGKPSTSVVSKKIYMWKPRNPQNNK